MSRPDPAGELPDLTERRIDGARTYEGRIVSVDLDEVRLPDGRTARRESVRHPGAVVVVPVAEEGDLLLVWQYRYPVGKHTLELPAGKIEPGEDPKDTAARELLEETGHKAGRIRHALGMFSTPGFSDERLELYVATGLDPVGHPGEEDEFVHVCRMGLDEAVAMADRGEVEDAKTLAGLFWAHRNL